MDSIETLLALSKRTAWSRVTASQKVSVTPSFIFGVALCSDGSGHASANVYDGESANDEDKIDLRVESKGMFQQAFWPPVFFRRGIYVACGSNVQSVQIQYLTVKE